MFRKSTLLLFVLLMLVAAPLTLAQDTFGLSMEDFGLLTSQDMDATSVSFDLAMSLNITGSPDGDVLVDLNGTGAFGEGADGSPIGSFNLTGAANAGGESIPVDFQMRIVDNILYMNLGDGNGWQGQTLDDAMSTFGNMAPLPVNPMDLASGNMADNPQAMEAMGEMMNAFEGFDPSTLISMSRLDDMGGQAHFHIDVDLQSFLSSEAFNKMMSAAGTMSGDESVAGMGAMLGAMFQDMTLTLDEFIELETSRARQAILNFGMGINPAMMGVEDAGPMNVGFMLDISNLQYDVMVDVTAPEGATLMGSAAG